MASEWNVPGLLETAIEQAYSAVVITDADMANDGPHVLLCNPAFLRMTGYEREEILGRNLRILQGPDTDREVIVRLRDCLDAGTHFEGSTVNYRKDGSPYDVQWSISPVRDESGSITNYVSVQQDISARLRAEAERDMLAEALQAAADPIMVTDDHHRVLYVNQAFERVFGYPSSEILGLTPAVLYDGTGDEAAYDDITMALADHRPVRRQVSIRTRDGRILHTAHAVTPNAHVDSRRCRNVSTFSDITDLVEVNEELRVQAVTDGLTGLRNRQAGEAALHARVRAAQREGGSLAIALCDIDHFKRVNDTFGHAVGDRVLVQVATQLKSLIRDQDCAVRWGGEEFLLILPGAALAAARGTAERIRSAIEATPDIEVGRITISIGVDQLLPDDDVTSLLARTDRALYAAKGNGRNRVEAGFAA